MFIHKINKRDINIFFFEIQVVGVGGGSEWGKQNFFSSENQFIFR